MSFAKDKARMLRILAACDAPPEVVREFRHICDHWQAGDNDTAEDLLLDACKRHNFVRPWQEDGREVEFRPVSIGPDHPAHVHDAGSRTPEAEQCYRRGYHQGLASAIQELRKGGTIAKLEEIEARVDQWRRQAVQHRGATPGYPRPRGLPAKWEAI